MKLSKEKQGEMLILVMAVLWGLFPVITVLSINEISPLASLGWSTLFAAIFFGIIIFAKNKQAELKNKSALGDIILTALLLGVAYYLLYFFGLRYTSAGNASLIALTEVFFSFLFFHVWHKDYISAVHIAGAIFILAGAVIVLYPNITHFKSGDILILGAALVAPFGNFFQQRARKKVGSEAIMFIRTVISTIVIFSLMFFLGTKFSLGDIKKYLPLLAINGILLLGLSKIMWVEAIHRISVTKATALSSVSPLVTLFTAWLLLHNLPTGFQLFSFLPMFLGIVLLSNNKKQ